MRRAAAEAEGRLGVPVRPAFVSLDPVHDSPADLRTALGRSGSASTLVVAGPPDGLLSCAERYKNQVAAARLEATRDKEKMKKGKDMGGGGFVSDHGAL